MTSEYVKALVDSAPPLTSDQIARLTTLMDLKPTLTQSSRPRRVTARAA